MLSLPLFPRFFVVFIFSSLFLLGHFPVLLILRLLLLLSIIEEIIEGLTPLLSSLFLFIHLSPKFLLLFFVEFIQKIFIPAIERIKLSPILSPIIRIPSSFLPLRWLFILTLLLLLSILLLLLPRVLWLLSERASIIGVPIPTEPPSPCLLLLALLTVCTHAVILRLLLLIPEDIVSSSDFLELIRGLPLVFVWVVLLCEFVIGRFDVFLGGWGRHSQYFVVVFVRVEVRWLLHSKEFTSQSDESRGFRVISAVKEVEKPWVEVVNKLRLEGLLEKFAIRA